MKHHTPTTIRTLAFILALVLVLVSSPNELNALQPVVGAQGGIPTKPTAAALKRGRDTAGDYVDNYGDLSITIATYAEVKTGKPVGQPMIDAINAEIAEQFRKYTGNQVDVIGLEFGADRVKQVMARVDKVDNGQRNPADNKADEAIFREMVSMSQTPYMLIFNVGPSPDLRVKDAGVVTIRFIEVATGRELFQISDQFWQEKNRNIPESVWIQHSVTYWMEEIFDADEVNFPSAFQRFRAPIDFVGDVPDNLWLRQAIADATGIDKNKINPRRTRADGLDKVSLTLSLDAPPHVMIDEVIVNLQKKFAEKDLAATPLSQDGGSIIFGVSAVPMWHVLTSKETHKPQIASFQGEFTKAYNAIGSPNIAVLTYGHAGVDWRVWGGDAQAMGTACEGILSDLNASIVGVGTIDKNFADIRSAAVDGRYGQALRQALPNDLRERTDWVLMVEVVPAYRERHGYKLVATARLIDLQQDRVVGAAIFPADDSLIPAGEAKLEPLTHGARYLTGSVCRTLMKRLSAGAPPKVLDVVIENAPSFEFVNRIDNIVSAREQVVSTKLPAWNKDGGRYAFEAQYTGDGKAMLERLRADLGTLPLEIKQLDAGKVVLEYKEQPEAP